MLGGILALLSAASFGLNDVAIRRGVLTGTPFQAMAISLPVGVLVFLIGALIAGTARFSVELGFPRHGEVL